MMPFAQLAVLAILLLASAFFSGSESALFSLSGSTVAGFATSKKRHERAVARLLADRQALLVSLLLGNLLVNLAATSRATSLLIHALGESSGSWVAWLGMTVMILVVGEITPKMIAIQNSGAWAVGCARPLSLFSRLILPIRLFLVWLVSPLVSKWGIQQGYDFVELAELRTAVDEGWKAGKLHQFESDLVSSLLELEELRVKEIMTPRVKIKALAAEVPLAEMTRGAWRMRRTRVPVYSGTVDNIMGVLHLKDLAGVRISAHSSTAGDLARKAMYVPSGMAVSRLLLRFRAESEDIAVVVDQFGSVAGLVTLQDIVDEILGPLPDKHDPASPVLTPYGPGTWLIPAVFPLDELSERLGIQIDDPLVETIGGHITHCLGRVPKTGEEIILSQGLRIKVLRAEPRKLVALSVTVTDPMGVD